MKKEIKQVVANLIWDICNLSPEHANGVLDIIGADAYKKVIDLAKDDPLLKLMHDLDSINIPYEYAGGTLYYPKRYTANDRVYSVYFFPERKDRCFDMCNWEKGMSTKRLFTITEEKAFNLILTHWHLKKLEEMKEANYGNE